MKDEDNGQNRAERSTRLLDSHNNSQILIVPAIVPLEIAASARVQYQHSPSHERSALVSKSVEAVMERNFMPADISPIVVRKAAELVPRFNLKAPDALLVASGLVYGASRFYTWDEKLIRQCSSLDGLTLLMPPESDVLF